MPAQGLGTAGHTCHVSDYFGPEQIPIPGVDELPRHALPKRWAADDAQAGVRSPFKRRSVTKIV